MYYVINPTEGKVRRFKNLVWNSADCTVKYMSGTQVMQLYTTQPELCANLEYVFGGRGISGLKIRDTIMSHKYEMHSQVSDTNFIVIPTEYGGILIKRGNMLYQRCKVAQRYDLRAHMPIMMVNNNLCVYDAVYGFLSIDLQ